ncbi:hypothetical protein DID88_010150 [Monilinia fructigena]|uniref:Uncharacterized protein n=1 Tax=Monilinia fructigena TaxID=38457 RepID=A0A395IKN1_9HELO|nr:hypothetical protein DID88_010150 [Monilinia fructigena]
MPALDVEEVATTEAQPLTRLPFGPITKCHILNCSYDNWHAKYRSSTLKSRIIPLTSEFLSYLREDGIVLPSEIATFPPPESYNNNSTSGGWDEDEVAESDPSDKFAEIHKQIQETILELGGSVVPKLNWSAPKDATWISLKQNNTFPDRNFSFDVYIPEPFDKVRLVDINPWAPRTDPLLFSWLELLTMSVPPPLLGTADSSSVPPLPTHSSDEDDGPDAVEEIGWMPDFRLVKKDDPEAYSFASPQYSAHKMPQDVVEAGASGEGGMREFADNWQRMLNGELEMMRAGEDSDDDDNDPDDRIDS